MPKKKPTDINNWGFIRFETAIQYWNNTGDLNVKHIITASKSTPMATILEADERDKRVLLGVAWDCCVAIREKMLMPALPGFKDIQRVSNAVKAHLGEADFELFLNPAGKAGLPPRV